MFDGKINVQRVLELVFHEVAQVVPNTRVRGDLKRLQRLTIHVHMEQEPEEQSTKLIWQGPVLRKVYYCVKLVHVLETVKSFLVSTETELCK